MKAHDPQGLGKVQRDNDLTVKHTVKRMRNLLSSSGMPLT